MTDAQSLFREGVLALREQQDVAEGRRLLTESLKINPQNEMAWLWLARTLSDPAKRIQCIDRALSINPDNEQALALKRKYSGVPVAEVATVAPAAVVAPFVEADANGHTPQSKAPPAVDQRQIKRLFKEADDLVEAGDVEGAIEQWVRVLEIEVDNEVAMRNAVGYLSRLKYIDDAKELVWRAIDSGTTHPSIYLTALDIARYQNDYADEEVLCERVVAMPEIDDSVITAIVGRLIDAESIGSAEDMLEKALESRPKSQKLLKQMGDLRHMMGDEAEAARYYDRAARLGTSTKEGREADKKLTESAAVLTDRERGSLVLAWREAAGIAVFYVLLAWQDAGMNLLALGVTRWLGVIVALIGGYLTITATSSPQQQPLATWLGGEVPPEQGPKNPPKPGESTSRKGLLEDPTELPIIPPAFRAALGAMGVILLLVAAWLVFNSAINLLGNPVPPTDIPSIFDLMNE